MPRSGLILALTLVLGACAGAPSKTATHEGLARDPGNMPRRILLLPAEVRVHEISTGGVVEQVDAWTAAASGHADQCVRALAAGRGAFELVDSPALSAEQKAVLDQHIALYDQVAGSAYIARASMFPAWRERAKTFDYTLGPGLKPLADQTGIEAAMIVSGSDYISSAGRKAAMVMGTIVAAAFGAVIVPQGGTSFISVGVVDLRTGDLLWFGTDQSQGADDLRNEADVKRMLDGLFQTFPGLAPAHKSGT
jgi:hypothetical protein